VATAALWGELQSGTAVAAGLGVARGNDESKVLQEACMSVTDSTTMDPALGAGEPRAIAPLISVVIPTLNEAANLPHVLTRIPASVSEVVLVDGHSVDDTIAVARQLRPDVRVVLQDGRGKGNALACGFAAASGEIIVMLDADGSTDPAEIPAFVAALLDGADFAKGSRFMTGGGSADITPVRRAGNRALAMVVNTLFRTRYSDLCYGYNAFWSHCLKHIRVDCAGFEVETVINVRVARARLQVAEVPSVEHERIHGESNLNAVRDGLRVLRAIVTERLRRRHRRHDADWRPTYRELAPDLGEHTLAIAPLDALTAGNWGILPITIARAERAPAG
jgi:glycosyltransferase involved in cell wall biosynthesis